MGKVMYMKKGEVHTVPKGYIEIAYIRSSGTQYIDTGFIPTNNTRVVMSAKFESVPSSDEALFGVRASNTNQFWCYWRNAAAAFSCRFGNSSTNSLVTATATDKNTLDMNGNVLTIGDTSASAAAATFTAEYPIFLFAVNNAGTFQYPASVQIYSCQIYDNGTLIRDFVPCISSAGEIGMYDKVYKKFYGNDGTGSFLGTKLDDMTWAEIRDISATGLASNFFAVGDTKTITISGTVGNTVFSALEIDAFIIGIDHNSDFEGSGIHFQIGKIDDVAVALIDDNYGKSTTASGAFTMNTTNAYVDGGWAGSHMRKIVLGSDGNPSDPTANTLLAALPSDLRAVMKPVTKYSDNVGGSNDASNVTAILDYLWLLAEYEVQGTRTYANSAEQNYQKQYDYYAAGNSKIKYKHTVASTLMWWLRSVRGSASASTSFCRVDTDGGAYVNNVYYSLGIAPAFCV